MSFETWNPEQLPIPVGGDFGEAYAAALGQMQDAELALLRVALLCRFPARCPVDALELLGSWYRLPRYPGESDDVYRARLVAAWETWEEAGSPACVEAQLRAAFGAGLDVRVYRDEEPNPHENRWYSRFDLLFGPNMSTIEMVDCVLGQCVLGVTPLGSSMRADQRRLAKAIVLRFKAAHGYAAAMLVRRGGDLLGVDFTLGVSPLGGVETTVVWIGRLLGTRHGSTLGFSPLGGYNRS
jgi:hypothetical protein